MQRLTAHLILFVAALCLLAPSRSSASDAFLDEVDLTPLSRATVQHHSTLKTLDTVARKAMSDMSGRSTLDGQNPTATLFDMAFRPATYADRPFIKIEHLPLRQDLANAIGYTEAAEPDKRHQFLKGARVAPSFALREDVDAALTRIESRELYKAEAVMRFRQQSQNARHLLEAGLLPPLRIIPPAPGENSDGKWHSLPEVLGQPDLVRAYDVDRLEELVLAAGALRDAYRQQDVSAGNAAAQRLADALIAVNPEAYPNQLKRQAEVAYNRLAQLTLPGAFVYFIALVLMLVAAYADTPRLRLWGIRFLILGFLVHTAGIGIRWWLVEKSTGDTVGWFHAIPIKNQFESVMFSAWFGVLVGGILELVRRRAGGGVFGASAAFVGFLSLVALFASPHVFGRDIGGQIGQAQGILMSYWLYVHVTVVVASYALIAMNFLLSVWWLVASLQGKGSAETPAGGVQNGGFWRTLGRAAFLPIPAGTASTGAFEVPAVEKPRTLLQRLDAANLVILQMAFWLLGAGIVFGAVWADMSWGRPWGWDPKETFALVTWIVYLVVLHIRLVTKQKALWTAILGIIGFFVMLFNWIGVNFFFQGLHSYA
jgi:cytochrome c-type biogenesis protein CcsB